MPERIPQSATIRVPLQAYLSSDHVSSATGKTIAITISKNGGAYGNPSGGATNATEIASGSYYVDLSTTDTGTLGPLFVKGSVTDVDDVVIIYNVVKATNGGLTALPDTAVTTNASLVTSGTGTDQISVGSGRVDVAKIAGTSQTARDIGASVLLSSGTGTGQLSLSSGTVTVGTNNDKTGYTASTVSDKTGYALTSAYDAAKTAAQASDIPSAATVAGAVWDVDATGHQTQGTFGQAIGDPGADTDTIFGLVNTNLDAAVSTRLASSSYTAPDNSDITAIKTKTDSLTFTVSGVVDANVVDWKGSSAPANTGDAYARLGAPTGASISADIVAVKAVDDAIKLKTDNLPSDPADESLIIAATDAISAKIGTPSVDLAADIAAVKTDSAAIKTQTDKMVFTVANQIDANIQSVNDVTVTGTGASGNEWGP